jgi:hypothetical protein
MCTSVRDWLAVALDGLPRLLDKESSDSTDRTDPSMDSGDQPLKSGRSVGRHAPTTAMQVSGIVQYMVGASSSVCTGLGQGLIAHGILQLTLHLMAFENPVAHHIELDQLSDGHDNNPVDHMCMSALI